MIDFAALIPDPEPVELSAHWYRECSACGSGVTVTFKEDGSDTPMMMRAPDATDDPCILCGGVDTLTEWTAGEFVDEDDLPDDDD